MPDFRAFQVNAFQNSTIHKYEAFQTLGLTLAVGAFPLAADMQLLGTGATSNLYWDYSNTQDFWLLETNAVTPTFTILSPAAANNWFQTQVQTTFYNPFAYNNSRPLSTL